MQKFDVFKIGADLYLVVQAQHLLDLNTVVLVPILPSDALPPLRPLTIDIQIEGDPYRIRAHMPLTVDAQLLRHLKPVHQLSPEEGQNVMDGLNTILWGL
ncbi:CcdB protein [Rhodovulum sp. ES.010]|uniref:CcdB family protein n=1 Tax=Rhodovulum sp. ES.010 TaxID=1882821 RepID=UPI0009281287|nr:CcdB family protein [Rhodovulum sp. ES.010]SIO59922.1 CcdB protein [Rhodovulum sp. ES.010]